MKNRPPVHPANGVKYTPDEILALIRAAKSEGCHYIELAGFKTAWALPRGGQAPPPTSPPRHPDRRRPQPGVEATHCPKHGEELRVGRGAPYCYSCWREGKEERGEWEDRAAGSRGGSRNTDSGGFNGF